MNTGIQNATNLAWKLAIILKAKGPNLLLNAYEIERRRIGKILLKTTDQFFAFITTKNFFISHLRNSLLTLILPFFFSKKKKGERHLFRFISQLNIHYHKNKFVDENKKNADSPFKRGPQAGYRPPDAPIDESALFMLLQKKPIHLLVFENKNTDVLYLTKLKNLEKLYIDWLQTHLIMASLANQIIFHLYGVTSSAIYANRPDAYRGFCSFSSDLTLAENYLKTLSKKSITGIKTC